MGKLSAIAERIADTKARLEAEADKLALKLDGIDAAAPKAFDRGHAFLDSQKAEVDEIESTLRQLSNLPFDSEKSSSDSGKAGGSSKPNGGILPSAGNINAPAAMPGPSGGTAKVTPFPDERP